MVFGKLKITALPICLLPVFKIAWMKEDGPLFLPGLAYLFLLLVV
jgi:hypothetical protein